MVKPRSNVEFNADFPDDTVYGEDGDELQFAGQNVAEAIAGMLVRSGYEVSTPENCYELGWEFDAIRRKSRFWVRLTKIHEFVLVSQDMTFRLWPDRRPYAEFLRSLHSALTSDPRFGRVRWFKGDLPSDGGAWSAEPVDA